MDKSDVYSFGVLIMEIISGRTAIDCRQPQLEVTGLKFRILC